MKSPSKFFVFLVWLGIHANILVICGVLTGSLYIQFAWNEFPCRLCMAQRMSMLLCGLAQAFLLCRIRVDRRLSWRTFVTAEGMTLCAALTGACISLKHILLHITPPDPGYGTPVWGLHLYTWAFFVFAAECVAVGINLLIAPESMEDMPLAFGWFSRTVLILFAVVIVALAFATFLVEGLHWNLPNDPIRNELLYDLGFRLC